MKGFDRRSPKIDITENQLTFKGYGEGAKGLHDYEFDLELNDEINIEKSAYRILERQIDFNLYKAHEGIWWQRLTKRKVKLSWLRIDFDRWRNEDDSPSEEEEESEPRKVLECVQQMRSTYSTPAMKPPSPEQLEQIDKMQKDLLEVKDKAYADIKNCYLFFYNTIQFILFGCTFVYLLQRYAIHGKENMKEAFDRSVMFIGMSQILAVLESVHAATGLVKSGVSAILMQLFGRNFVLFLVILPAEPVHSQPMVCYLFLVWSAVEVIRYPFYAFSCMNIEFEVLTWLRYTVWIPLYPLGFISEAIVILLALPYYQESNLHSVYLPNDVNISFYFPYYMYFHVAVLPFAGFSLMRHMWRMRKKKLAALAASVKKEKMS